MWSKVKYSSYLFDIIGRVIVYIVEGQRYRKDVGYSIFDSLYSISGRPYNHIISQPRLSNIAHIDMPQKIFDDGQIGYEMSKKYR